MIDSYRLYNNIYGTLVCNTSLEKPCKILRYGLGLTEAEVYVYKSQFDGAEYLKVRTKIYYLETDKTNQDSEHLFNGEVAGDTPEVITRVKAIADVLNRHNYQCQFEIYDDNLEFIEEYPKSVRIEK